MGKFLCENNWDSKFVYENYFDSGIYTKRYPVCNQHTLKIIIDYARNAKNILDFGCGHGRYTFPVLQHTTGHLVAYDICPSAIKRLHEKLDSSIYKKRVTLITNSIEQLEYSAPFDLIISIFGVFSHIANKNHRIRLLLSLYKLLQINGKEGTLILSVPNAYRRFWKEQQLLEKL